MIQEKNQKPLGIKNYGHIAHLPNSRIGVGDHHCHEGQARIATAKTRDKHDFVIVQEKLDGSNVGVALHEGVLYPLSRSGYVADSSPFRQHWEFANWVYQNQNRFLAVLEEGERLVGEWLMQAHGTRYELKHEPFVAFDIMRGTTRTIYKDFIEKAANGDFITPHVVHQGSPISVSDALEKLGKFGFHGAIDVIEGAVWRVERNEITDKTKGGERSMRVDFLTKYVRPDKQDGNYLPEISGKDVVWNWQPILDFGFWILDFGFRIEDESQKRGLPFNLKSKIQNLKSKIVCGECSWKYIRFVIGWMLVRFQPFSLRRNVA